MISDITGLTGLAIVDAILNGERSPFTLAKLRHDGIKASEEVIANRSWAITGPSTCSRCGSHWRPIAIGCVR